MCERHSGVELIALLLSITASTKNTDYLLLNDTFSQAALSQFTKEKSAFLDMCSKKAERTERSKEENVSINLDIFTAAGLH